MTPAPAAAALATPLPRRPRTAPRATRAAGQRTRSLLLDAATRLFAAHGLAGVSLGDLAAEADAFPSQVTYYFGSKEALFVEAACREVLHLGARVEAAGAGAATRTAYAGVMTAEALRGGSLLFFAEALLLARQRPPLEPLVARTLARLHEEGARAVSDRCSAMGWPQAAAPVDVAAAFWATVLGLALQRAGSGAPATDPAATAAVLAALDAPASHHVTEAR